MKRVMDEGYLKKLMIISGILLISSFLISFLMVLDIIPPTIYVLPFIAYGLSFLGLNLFIYAYYQYVRLDEEE